jgi:hypothetical protein
MSIIAERLRKALLRKPQRQRLAWLPHPLDRHPYPKGAVMGQAKKRGTRKDRIEQAKIRASEEQRDRELRRVIESSTGRSVTKMQMSGNPGRPNRLFALLAASALAGRK